MKRYRVGSDFSGVGAFNQALTRLGIDYEEVFACDWDKYARETFIHNYGQPKYYPKDVYDREIPKDSLDIYMTSPPCQAFSLAGKRLGKEDKRGILFFNSLEFIQVNKPRYFIFENVKGLLSDDNGKTFSEWVNLLGGKSVNGNSVIFPYEDSLPYHLHWQVLNAKHHGVPQNRERVFLIGIRDDKDNNFRFPVEEHLTKRLKDVLENDVDGKYFLSDKIIKGFKNKKNAKNYPFLPKDENDISQCLTARYFKMGATDPYIQINSATTKGYEEKNCQQGVIINKTNDFWVADYRNDEGLRIRKDNISPCMAARKHSETDISTMCPLIAYDYKIRRLTPRECFRLMDFPDTFTWPVSDSQAYKQAGNSIVVRVLEKIIKNFAL